jgi:hypothetical protein
LWTFSSAIGWLSRAPGLTCQTADWRNAEIRRNRAGRSLCGGGEQLVKFFFRLLSNQNADKMRHLFFYFSISFENYFVVGSRRRILFKPRDLNSQNKRNKKAVDKSKRFCQPLVSASSSAAAGNMKQKFFNQQQQNKNKKGNNAVRF